MDLTRIRVPLLVVHHRYDACPACVPRHYHGFNGMEREAVGAITEWMRQPRS